MTTQDNNGKTQALESLLASYSTAETLSLSDQHVTFLLTHSKDHHTEVDEDATTTIQSKGQGEGNKRQSLWKMTVIPSLKELLGGTLVARDKSTNDSPLEEQHATTSVDEENASSSSPSDFLIKAFLSQYEYKLTNESGAEYSYYRATSKSETSLTTGTSETTTTALLKRKRPTTMEALPLLEANKFNVELISPASQRQIARAMPSPGRSLIIETPEMYEHVTKAYIQDIVNGNSLSWVQNIIDGTKEKERILFQNDDWLLNIDTKWKSHPDPNSVPKAEWQQQQQTFLADLYCLGIAKHVNIASLRDLRQEHVNMLQSMFNDGLKTIHDVYGIEPNQIRVFCHYQPQFYHFHVHFTRIHNDFGCQVERGHLLTDMIQNLMFHDEYYKNRNITYTLSHNDKLFTLIDAVLCDGKVKIPTTDDLLN